MLQSSCQCEYEVKAKQALPQDVLVHAGGVGYEFKEKQAVFQNVLVNAGGAKDKKDMAAQAAHARGCAAQKTRMAELRFGHGEFVPLRSGMGDKIKKVKSVPPDVLVHAGGAQTKAKNG
eukprot:5001548-Pyramimonas_sp.AAC.1